MGKQNPSDTDLLGYSMDGFPIYGPLDDDSGLDECNGIITDDGYVYHARNIVDVPGDGDYCVDASTTPANQWNYILGCYRTPPPY